MIGVYIWIPFVGTFLGAACVLFKCKCGIILSKISKNAIPRANPTAAGINDNLPISSDNSVCRNIFRGGLCAVYDWGVEAAGAEIPAGICIRSHGGSVGMVAIDSLRLITV